MERLTKKELRALLECIKEGYPICDRETLQRVLSRLSKIVPTEVISYNRSNPLGRWSGCAIYPNIAHTPSQKKIFERVHGHPVFTHHAKTHVVRALNITEFLMECQFHAPGVTQQLLTAVGVKYRKGAQVIKEVAPNSKHKNSAEHDKIVLKLLRSHLLQAHHNAETVGHMQQTMTLVDRALDRLHLGLIVIRPDGKVGLATTCAVQQVRNYLGHLVLRGNCLPEVVAKWVRNQEAASRGEDDVFPQRDPLVLQYKGKRLVIRLVSDLAQRLLMLEEQPITTQPQSPAPFGLSPREAQVLDWVAQGKTNKEIGVILDLSPRTVQKHLEHIYRKIYVESRTAAAAKAYEIALIASKQTSMFFIIVISSLMI